MADMVDIFDMADMVDNYLLLKTVLFYTDNDPLLSDNNYDMIYRYLYLGVNRVVIMILAIFEDRGLYIWGAGLEPAEYPPKG